jgi:hypothetical protein
VPCAAVCAGGAQPSRISGPTERREDTGTYAAACTDAQTRMIACEPTRQLLRALRTSRALWLRRRRYGRKPTGQGPHHASRGVHLQPALDKSVGKEEVSEATCAEHRMHHAPRQLPRRGPRRQEVLEARGGRERWYGTRRERKQRRRTRACVRATRSHSRDPVYVGVPLDGKCGVPRLRLSLAITAWCVVFSRPGCAERCERDKGALGACPGARRRRQRNGGAPGDKRSLNETEQVGVWRQDVVGRRRKDPAAGAELLSGVGDVLREATLYACFSVCRLACE